MILRSEKSLILAKPRIKYYAPKPESEVAPKRERPSKKSVADLDYDKELFEKLRTLRRHLAVTANVAPFIIFGDVSLIAMAAAKPTDEKAFLEIPGVGQKKLESYGATFLQAIQQHLTCTPQSLVE